MYKCIFILHVNYYFIIVNNDECIQMWVPSCSYTTLVYLAQSETDDSYMFKCQIWTTDIQTHMASLVIFLEKKQHCISERPFRMESILVSSVF